MQFFARLGFLACMVLQVACNRKYEIVPAQAQQVQRHDTKEATDAGIVTLREYSFEVTVSGYRGKFLCESRSFPVISAARERAATTFPQRPEWSHVSGEDKIMQSGRSTWMLRGKHLTWCMLAPGEQPAAKPAIMESIRMVFLAKFSEEL